MTARDILAKLALRHADAVFVPECRNGPAAARGLGILDAVAIARSWSKPRIYGYEIKVSRSDFLRDEKWQTYLPMCNDLYFVCPRNLIQPNEVPEGVGLLWAGEGTRLFTKVRAPRRNIEPPVDMLKYILISRAKIESGWKTNTLEKKEYWANWLQQRNDDIDFGHMVSRRLSETIKNKILKVECENRRLAAENKSYAEVAEAMKKLSLSPGNIYNPEETLKRRIAAVESAFPPPLVYSMRTLVGSIQNALAAVDSAKGDAA
jgi:hypothetical protein